MAESDQQKGHGIKFAEQQLLRHGWEKGKGLGRNENGISEAINVKMKCGKGGVGHREGDKFAFHWWDHVFNKASSNLEVESDHNGVKVKKLVEGNEEGMISNKKPIKSTLAMQDKLYGCFVKSATLISGQEKPEPRPSSLDAQCGSDDENRSDLSSTTKLSDADLVKACGGLTAHKGARHGFTMKAKLARLEQQEQEFMEKYNKKSQPAVQPAPSVPEGKEGGEKSQSKKLKRSSFTNNNEIVADVIQTRPKERKRKSSKKARNEETMIVGLSTEDADQTENNEVHQRHKKRKRKSNQDVSKTTVSIE